jgi:hypothetical protein
MQIATTMRRRSIGCGASLPYTSHPFWLSVPTAGSVGLVGGQHRGERLDGHDGQTA